MVLITMYYNGFHSMTGLTINNKPSGTNSQFHKSKILGDTQFFIFDMKIKH